MRRWVWRVLLAALLLAALTGTVSAETVADGYFEYTSLGNDCWEVTKYNSSASSATIPDKFRGRPVTSIGDNAFAGKSSLKTVTIPETITNIGANAFFGTGLTKVAIPSRVEKIGESAFENCTSLSALEFRDNVAVNNGVATVGATTEIGNRAFYLCKGLRSIQFSGSVKSIGDNAFSGCAGLGSIVLLPGTTHIGEKAFSQCDSVTMVVIAGTVTDTIPTNAFSYVRLNVIHYGGDSYPGDLPDGWTQEDNIHKVEALRSVTAPTCTKDGSVDEPISCEKNCNLRHEAVRPVPKGHDYTDASKWQVTYDPDPPLACQDQSVVYVRACAVCGLEKTERETIRATADHTVKVLTEAEQEDAKYIKSEEPATCGEDGSKVVVAEVCSVCGKELKTEEKTIPATGAHVYDKGQVTDDFLIEARCDQEGLKVVLKTCDVCGQTEERPSCDVCKDAEEIDKDHWIDDHGAEVVTVAHQFPAEPSFTVDTPATCVDEGEESEKKLCEVCGAPDPDFTGGQTRPIPALGHDLEQGTETVTKQPTCTEAGEKEISERKCLREGCGYVEPKTTGTVPPQDHNWSAASEVVIKEATCTEEGLKQLGFQKCSRCGQTKTGEVVNTPKLPHEWGDPVVDEENATEPTCGEPGEIPATVACKVCGEVREEVIPLPATGEHAYGEWTTEKEPTATEDGSRSRTCGTCGHVETQVLPATGTPEDPDGPDDPDNPTDPGNPDKPTDPDNPTTPETKYSIDLIQANHGSVSTSRSTAAEGTSVTLTVWADSGYELDTIRVTTPAGYSVSLYGDGRDRYTFTMPNSRVEVRVNFTRRSYSSSSGSSGSSGSSSGSSAPVTSVIQSVPRISASGQLFSDIPLSHWAAGEINWANQMGYMNGSGRRFNPDGSITFQQLWMVMARLTGSRPANMEDARRWAVNGGFAEGANPDMAVNRHQLVTALYRCARLMGSTNSNTTSLAAYTDSRNIPISARGAMSWAVANGIVSGTANGKLNPTGTLTRAQFAVILYRFAQRI